MWNHSRQTRTQCKLLICKCGHSRAGEYCLTNNTDNDISNADYMNLSPQWTQRFNTSTVGLGTTMKSSSWCSKTPHFHTFQQQIVMCFISRSWVCCAVPQNQDSIPPVHQRSAITQGEINCRRGTDNNFSLMAASVDQNATKCSHIQPGPHLSLFAGRII